VDRQPFPTDLGSRIVAEICAECWEEWKERQMLLINHHGLKLQEADAREYLYSNLRAFLFGEGESTADIDPAEEGSVDW
jgi:Fe-S cluster biosynthesis and repair protein YggX